MVSTLRVWWLPAALLGVFAGLLAWELLLPGYIGLADNGDFGKVTGHLGLASRRATNFVYFQPECVWSKRNYWDSPYFSSETLLAWLALELSGGARAGRIFDMRWIGAIHMVLMAAAIAFLLAALRGQPKWAQAAIAAVPILIFTDVCYAAYCNTFYMDAATLSGLLLMTALAVWIVLAGPNRIAGIVLFTAAAMLFVLSKTQHAVWMVFPAAFLATRGRRAGWIAAALVMLAGIGMLVTSDRSYRGQAMFNVLFYRLGRQEPAPAQDLLALGVQPAELRFIGMHSYVPASPIVDRQWTEGFYARTGFRRLAMWYVRHPSRTLHYLTETLTEGGRDMRPFGLGNFPPGQGHQPGERTTRMALWTDWRSALFRRWPWHIVAWYGLFVAGCLVVWTLERRPAVRRLALLALGIALLGTGEFFAASLGDPLDPARHLFQFHVCTELTVCFGAAWVVARVTRRPEKPGSGPVPPPVHAGRRAHGAAIECSRNPT